MPALRVDPRYADPAGAFAHVRRGVADRLLIAQSQLPAGLQLLVFEGYRPMPLQIRLFTAHVDRLRAIEPNQPTDWYHRRASRYISPPDVAPHVAGAAVDLSLSAVDGSELWLGTKINDSDTEDCHTGSTGISADARENRRVLGAALTAAGLVNYPTEWWHWSYGDRYWAYLTGAAVARYGPANLP